MPTPQSRSYGVHFVIVFLFICLNLRLSISATDPILTVIMHDLGLRVGSSALFALLPVIALGVAAPLGAGLVSYVRPRHLIAYAILFAVGGIVWRSYGGIIGLYGGTLTIGLGLGITGSVVLGVVKDLFPSRVPELMGAYTACVCVGTSLGASTSDPVMLMMGDWQRGLLFWAAPLILALLLWVELIERAHPLNIRQDTMHSPIRQLLRQSKAWWVSIFYLFRVAGAWIIIAWLSTLMHHRGLSMVEAGLVLGLSTVSQLPGNLLSDHFVQWLGGRPHLMLISIPLSVLAIWGLLLGPLSWWPVFAVIFGLGIGCVFTLGMTLIVDSSADAPTTVALSGMAQGMGFLFGGVLAWIASDVMDTAHPAVSMACVYSVFAVGSLVSGLCSNAPGKVSLPSSRR